MPYNPTELRECEICPVIYVVLEMSGETRDVTESESNTFSEIGQILNIQSCHK